MISHGQIVSSYYALCTAVRLTNKHCSNISEYDVYIRKRYIA